MGFVGIIIVLAAVDLCFKWMIQRQSQEEFPRPLKNSGGKIWLYRNHNAGFPFGFLEKYRGVVKTVPLVIISGLIGVFGYLLSKKGNTGQKIGLGILLGGALSNQYDRMVRHYVVDYICFQFKGLKKVVFNLGDLCVFTGAGVLLVLELIEEVKGK